MRLLLRGTPQGIRPIHTQAYIFQRVLVTSLNIRGCRRRAARDCAKISCLGFSSMGMDPSQKASRSTLYS